MKSILVFIIFFFFTNLLYGDELNLDQLYLNLNKINKSIDETRKKIVAIRDARFLPELYLILAELHIDKSRYLTAIKKSENPKTPMNELDFSKEVRPKIQAIEIYQNLLDKFPRFENRDKALFFMAHEYRELGKQSEMIKVYQQLTRRYPTSQFWEESQMILGNYFLETKKEIPTAKRLYERIIDRPPNPFSSLAYYKLGWVYINLKRFRNALISFENVLTKYDESAQKKLPEAYKKTDVRRDALVALVKPYTDIPIKDLSKLPGTLNRLDPISYFYKLSDSIFSYRIALSKLGARLILKKRYTDAVRIEFERVRVSTKLLDRLDGIERAYIAMKNSRRPWPINGYIELIESAMNEVSAGYLPEGSEGQWIKKLEVFGRDIVTRMDSQSRYTRNPRDQKSTINSYKSYLRAFSESRKEKSMKLNLAESLYRSRDYVGAGREYAQLGLETNKSNIQKKIWSSAIQSFVRALRSPKSLSRLELVEARRGLREVGFDYLKQFPRDKAVSEILFNIGRTYYDERNFVYAAKAFERFLSRFPKSRRSRLAADLVLDSFNQKEDYSGLIKAGRRILKNKNLKRSIRATVAKVIKQAEFKRIQVKSGDFSSPSYTKNLLKFAQKYKGSQLGDKALYEAFQSLKAKKDPRAYDPGEQLLIEHENSQYAKQVTIDMGKMALLTADFRRAAKYFEIYAKRYPSEKDTKSFMKEAAQMREYMGDFELAAEDYRFLGDVVGYSRSQKAAGNWRKLVAVAPKVDGLFGMYWEALAWYRLGRFARAKKLLLNIAKLNVSSQVDKEMVAHSRYLLSNEYLEAFKRVRMTEGDEAKAIQLKDKMLNRLVQQLGAVLNMGSGRWSIAALYSMGLANKEFADFILGAPIPKGLNKNQETQYKNALQEQASQFINQSEKYFAQCLETGEKFEVFTQFAKGCYSKGSVYVDEASETQLLSRAADRAPASATDIRQSLYDNPRDIKSLHKLAKAYIDNRDFSMALVILNRAEEISSKNSQTQALKGLASMFMNDWDEASYRFKSSLAKSQSNRTSLWGLAALYKEFRYKRRFKKVYSQAKRAGRPSSPLHPWMESLLQR